MNDEVKIYIRNNFFLDLYLGGAKVWECTQDMGDFLTQKDGKDNCLVDTFRDTLVLDLGCGAGVLGILALQNGAIVHFQDYVMPDFIQF